LAKLLRKKSGLVVAFGACAHIRRYSGPGKFFKPGHYFDYVLSEVPSLDNPNKIFPQEKNIVKEGELTLPKFYNTVFTLDQVIDVDYYLPGCAPPPDLIMNAVEAILTWQPFHQKGLCWRLTNLYVIAAKGKLQKPEKAVIKQIREFTKSSLIRKGVFWTRGLSVWGLQPVTVAVKGASMPICHAADVLVPRAGLRIRAQKFLSALTSIIDADTDEEIKKITDSIADPAGIFYFYSLPASMLRRKLGHK